MIEVDWIELVGGGLVVAIAAACHGRMTADSVGDGEGHRGIRGKGAVVDDGWRAVQDT